MARGAKEIVMTHATTRSAAVTGAGSGLGRDIALGLAAKGYRVFGANAAPWLAPNMPRANTHGMF